MIPSAYLYVHTRERDSSVFIAGHSENNSLRMNFQTGKKHLEARGTRDENLECETQLARGAEEEKNQIRHCRTGERDGGGARI